MQPSIFLYMFFTGTAFSAAITTTKRAASSPTPAVKVTAPRVLSPATPPTAKDVQNSITNWATSVNTVNAYLNDPNNQTKLQSAVVFAKDEPVQLATLMKTPALSKQGLDAGKVLMGNFPSIVSNLNSVQTESMSTNDATAAVNFNRCCTVLPNIGTLWAAASNATKAAMPQMPNLEAQCSQMSCASGVSGAAGVGNVTAGNGMAPVARLR